MKIRQKIKCRLGWHSFKIQEEPNIYTYAVPCSAFVAKIGNGLFSEAEESEIAKFGFSSTNKIIKCKYCEFYLSSFRDVSLHRLKYIVKD